MPITKKYFAYKEKDSDTIAYYEYNNNEGLDIIPNKNTKIKDAISVDKMVIINNSLIEKTIDKKLNKRFNIIIQGIISLYEDDTDDGGERLGHILNEVNRLKMEYINTYKKLMSEEKQELFEKKVKILENELRQRIEALVIRAYQDESNFDYDEYEERHTRGVR